MSNTSLTTIDPLFVTEPLASPSGRFALGRPTGQLAPDQPSPDGLRPWGLRRMGPVALPTGRLAQWHYDPAQQVSLAQDGTPLAAQPPAAGTAKTTGSIGSEDPAEED